MTDLGGHVALVTGGAKRIGRAIVERLAAAGAGVVVHHHESAAEAKSLLAELKRNGHGAWSVQADLAGAKAETLVAAAAKAAGQPITLLVNNASAFPEARLDDLSWDDLTSSLRTDAWAPLTLTRQLAAQLPDGEDGAVVNLLDARIADDDRGHAGYWLAKRLLADLTRLCALEYAPQLRVNGVAPGPVLGPAGDAGFAARMAKHVPLGRVPETAEVAEAVAHLLAAGSTTGQILYVDGGRHLGRQPPADAASGAAKPHQRRGR